MRVGKFDAWVQHGGPIFSVDIDPTATRLATAGNDSKCRIWSLQPFLQELVKGTSSSSEGDATTAATALQNHEEQPTPGNAPLLAVLQDHSASVSAVRWSKSGRMLATASDDHLILIYTLKRGAAPVAPPSASLWREAGIETPDDTMLASCSVDNTVRVWSAGMGGSSWCLSKTLVGHTSLVKGVAWDPVGKYLASQSDDKSVIVWNTDTWEVRKRITGPFDNTVSAAFFRRLSWFPNGQILATTHAYDEPSHTSALIERTHFTKTYDFVGHRAPVVAVRANPCLFRPPADEPNHNDRDASGPFCCVALGSQDCKVTVWSTFRPRPVVILKDLFKRSVLDVAWTPDGYTMVAVSMDGTLGAATFEPEEIGVALSEEEKRAEMAALYGEATLRRAADVPESVAQLQYEREARQIQQQQQQQQQRVEQQLPMQNGHAHEAAEPPNGAPPAGSPAAPPAAEFVQPQTQQVEYRRADGKRRIIPMKAIEPPSPMRPLAPPTSTRALPPPATTAPPPPSLPPLPPSLPPPSTSLSPAQPAQPAQPAPAATPPPAQDKPTSSSAIVVRPAAATNTTTHAAMPPARVSSPSTDALPPIVPAKRKIHPEHNRGAPAKRGAKDAAGKSIAAPVEKGPADQRVLIAGNTTSTLAAGVSDHRLVRPAMPAAQAKPVVSVRMLASDLVSPRVDVSDASGSAPCVLEAQNPADADALLAAGGQVWCEVACSRGGTVIWTDRLQGRAVAVTGVVGRLSCVALEGGSLQLYTAAGRRALPRLMLPAPVSALNSHVGGMLLAAVASGEVFVWDTASLKLALKASLLPLVNDTKANVTSVRLSGAGIPMAVLSNRHAFAWHADMACWLRVADDSFAASDYASSTTAGHVNGVEVSGPPVEVTASLLDTTPSQQRATTARHLECQMAGAVALKNQRDYRRLRELCTELLGPPSVPEDAAASKVWQPQVLGLSKRELLRREVLPAMSANRALQRLLSEFADVLVTVSTTRT
eukprot:jgi/Chlat1/1331/Chrsp118S01752